MAFVAVASTVEPRAFSVGPLKQQILTYSYASGDASGTVTADRLSSVTHIVMDGGLVLTSAPSISANVVTLAFVDPAATGYGTIIVYGR